MKVIQLDLTGCKHLYDLHDRIRIAFNFPSWYGYNWSAFWDLLWSDCDADKVIIKGERSLPKELDKSLDKFHEILERNIIFCEDQGLNPFSYEIIS